jgi:peptide chain release factor 1
MNSSDFLDPSITVRLDEMTGALDELEADLATTAAEPGRYAELGKRHSEMAPLVDLYRRFLQAVTDGDEAESLARGDADLADDFRQLAREKNEEAELLASELKSRLTTTDPSDQKDVIVEIRAAAGGDEAAIWTGDLLRLYQRYAERHGFRVEAMDSTESEAGGYDKVTVSIKGKGAYSRFKYEAGVHRVQRVPKTEASGRIHTSTATVAVLPEVEDVEVDIDANDVKVDVYRSQGPGGQSVNTTDSAVRLTHLPTGLVVTCQDEKSQLQNKEKAFRILRARLYQMRLGEQQQAVSGARKAQVGTGERSEKIRTYNYKESRVTDHRLGFTIRRLDQVLEGDLDELVDAMAAKEQAERLAEG